MKKIRNDKSTYVSRSSLVQSSAHSKPKSTQAQDRGDFKIDVAGYLMWPPKQKVVPR